MKLETLDIVDLLIQATPTESASQLVQHCLQIGMTAQQYRASSLDANLPPFDIGHQLRFHADGCWAAGLDVLEKNGFVLQSGFQMFFYRGLFGSKSRKLHQKIVERIEQHYGPGVPTNSSGIDILNFSNDQSVCYTSTTKSHGNNVITVRVGNRRFWR